jgi:tRNA (guanine-N7-)-methyltransferase
MSPTQRRREIVLSGALYAEPAGVFDPEAAFGRRAPLLIDVGAARARYFRNIAPRLPQVDMLGIEVARKRVEAALARLASKGITNCRMMCGDAQRILRDHIAPDSVAAISVLFPDPWPKKRHARRRLMHQPGFVRLLAERLAPGGLFLFKTDAVAYFDGGLATLLGEPLLAATRTLDVALRGLDAFSLELPDSTWYEEVWRSEGRHTYAAAFRRLP